MEVRAELIIEKVEEIEVGTVAKDCLSLRFLLMESMQT